MNTDDPMADEPTTDDQTIDEHKKTQIAEDGTEQYIKDPIYDIMSDKEIDERSSGLLSLLEEYNDKAPEE